MTATDSQVIRNLIDIVAQEFADRGFGGPWTAAASLIYRTGLAESGYRVREQDGGGPALGYWQMEPATLEDIARNYLASRPRLQMAADHLIGEDHVDFMTSALVSGVERRFERNGPPPPWGEHPLLDDRFACVACRLHYLRVREALPPPDAIEQQAAYWKRHYNTEDGRGTVEHFLREAGE